MRKLLQISVKSITKKKSHEFSVKSYQTPKKFGYIEFDVETIIFFYFGKNHLKFSVTIHYIPYELH